MKGKHHCSSDGSYSGMLFCNGFSPKQSWNFLKSKTRRRNLICIMAITWLLAAACLFSPSKEKRLQRSAKAEAVDALLKFAMILPPLAVFGIAAIRHPAIKYQRLCFGCGTFREEFLDRCQKCGEDYACQELFITRRPQINLMDETCIGFERLALLIDMSVAVLSTSIFLAAVLMFLKPSTRIQNHCAVLAMAPLSTVAAAIMDRLRGRLIRRYTGLCLKCKSPLPTDKSTEFCPTCGATLLIQQLRKAPYGIT